MERQKQLEMPIAPRGYEMDASATVPMSVIGSHMEHARWSAMRKGTFAMSPYWGRGMIRAQRIEMLAPVKYGVDLLILTQVGRIGRTSFDFLHEVRRKADERVLVSASVTAVNIGEDARPTPLKPGAEAAVLEGTSPNVAALESEPPSDAWTRELVVTPSHQDVLQHVNHARYIDFVEDTRWLACRAGAYGPPGVAPRPKKLWIAYDDQARAGNVIEVATWTESSSAFGFVVRAGDTIFTRARVEV